MSRHCRFVILSLLTISVGCSHEAEETARRTLRTEDVPRVASIVHEDLAKHFVGIQKAATILAPYVAVGDPRTRDAAMCPMLTRLRQPPRGIAEFVVSPLSFLAVIGSDGKVICRDGENDRMKGMALAANYEAVRTAMESGTAKYQLAEFHAEGGSESSLSMLFVAPVRKDGRTIGAVAAGIPLRREAQRISRQLRLDHAAEINEGLVLWAYLYEGDRLFFFGTPPEVDQVVPRGAAIHERLATSPRGYTSTFSLAGRTYATAVVPFPSIGEDVGLILVRSAE